MSHHLDSPASRRDPRLNLTDLYLFDGRAGTVLVMVTNPSVADPDRPPGFHPEARYEFKLHVEGEPHESLTYRFAFGAADDDGRQPLTAHRLTGAEARDDAADGVLVARGSTGEVLTQVPGDPLRVWAGPAYDPFYLDLHQLGHILEGLQSEQPIDLGEWKAAEATSSFSDTEVWAIVLEIPGTDPILSDGRSIAGWGTTKLATDAGGWRQINRAATPMMWPLFRAHGGDDDSDAYSRDTAAHPADDRANDAALISGIVTAAARSTGTRDPIAYGRHVAERLLPDLLPYRVGTAAAFSFAGFNGRTLADNAPEVMYGLVTNSAFPTWLRPDTAAETRQDEFPYVVPRPRADD